MKLGLLLILSTLSICRCDDEDFNEFDDDFDEFGDDGDVVICDSSQLHGVSPIKGKGVRLSTVAYCDDGLATMGSFGKKKM